MLKKIEMKTIIAGSRSIVDFATVDQAVKDSKINITEVVSGTARGVDKLGEEWASLNDIPIKRFPADWQKYGNGAGFIRNKLMAEYADALIAVWDRESKGTENMIRSALENKIKVYIKYV